MRNTFLFSAASAALLVGLGLAGSAAAQDADPPADASTTARLAPSQAITGDLATAGDRDWFRLGVEPGQRYRITLADAAAEGEGQNFDPLLVLYGADGAELARNDDADGTLNSALAYAPSQAGDVFVEARGLFDDAIGRYTLTAEAAAIPPDDAGNDAATRARVRPGRSIAGALNYEGDVDWFRLHARAGMRYRIALDAAKDAAEPLGDPMLRVIGRDGAELAVNDDSQESLNAQLDFVPASSGAVFLEAGAFGGTATGAYTLNVEASRLPADSAPANTRTRARLALGESVTDSLDYAGDKDWRRIGLEQGQSYRFRLTGDGDETGALSDPLLVLYGPGGEELARDDDSGGGLNAHLEFTAPETAQYFVEARGFGEDAVGAYTLTAAAGDIPADASTDASLNAEGDYRESALAPAGDKDWYRIELTEGQGLRIGVNALEGEASLTDPMLALYGPDGAEIARDDDGGDGLNAWIEYAAAAAGPHYLEVRGFSEEAEGRYAIALTGGEIGASADTAEALAANGEGRASMVSPAGDVDWFSIELVEGRPYRFNLEVGDGSFDPLLTLYDGEGRQVAADDDGGTGLNSYLTFASTAGGLYFAAVSAFGEAGSGQYLLRVADTDVPGSVGADETLNASQGDDRVSRIDMPGDLDSYRVELEAGARYLIEINGEGEAPLTDPFLSVLNSSGEPVTSDDDSGDGLDARLRFAPETTDSYLLQASGLGGSTGWYKISIARE